MGQHLGGGILKLLSILKDHWGAVERDLAASGWTWNDVGDRLPFSQFVSFAVYAPAGTAVFTRVNEGWDATAYLLADLIDINHLLLWSKTKDAHEDPPRNQPKPVHRPGMAVEVEEPKFTMTVEDYLRLSGSEGGSD
jgi:hypothetical protein